MIFRTSTFLLALSTSVYAKFADSNGNAVQYAWRRRAGETRLQRRARLARRADELPEEAFALCLSVGDKLTSMLSEALQILVEKESSNGDEISKMMKDVYNWCADAPSENNNLNDQDVVQCQGYASLLLEIYEKTGEIHTGEQMLLSSFGSNEERKMSCGVLVNQLNKAIKKHTFQDVFVIHADEGATFTSNGEKRRRAQKSNPPFNPEGTTADVVVAKTQERAMALGPIAASMGVVVTTAVGTAYYLFELCHDYDGVLLLA